MKNVIATDYGACFCIIVVETDVAVSLTVIDFLSLAFTSVCYKCLQVFVPFVYCLDYFRQYLFD